MPADRLFGQAATGDANGAASGEPADDFSDISHADAVFLLAKLENVTEIRYALDPKAGKLALMVAFQPSEDMERVRKAYIRAQIEEMRTQIALLEAEFGSDA
jgi:hypothetical protein